MKIIDGSIKLQDVVYRLKVLEPDMSGFEDAWKNFIKGVYDALGGLSALPFYALKYSDEEHVGVEMYAPVFGYYKPGVAKDLRHITYFEIEYMLGTRIPQGTEGKSQAILEEIRQYLIDNELIQTTPTFYLPKAADESSAYTEVLVGFRSRNLAGEVVSE